MATFNLEKSKKQKNDGTTFSPEGIYMFLNSMSEYLNKVMVGAIDEGFKKNKPVEELEITIQWKVNGKPFDETEILKCYPKSAQFSLKALAQMILKKAENGR